MCALGILWAGSPEQGSKVPESGVTGVSGPLDKGAGNQTQILLAQKEELLTTESSSQSLNGTFLIL